MVKYFYENYINKEKGEPYTHLHIAGLHLGVQIPLQDLKGFYKRCTKLYMKRNPFYLVESSAKFTTTRFMLDLDIEVPKEEKGVYHHHMHDLIRYFCRGVKKITNKEQYAVICTALDTRKPGKDYQKFGFHVIFPYLIVEKISSVYITQELLKEVEKDPFCTTFKHNDWKDILDISIAKVPKKRLPGASKCRIVKTKVGARAIHHEGRPYTFYAKCYKDKLWKLKELEEEEVCRLYDLTSLIYCGEATYQCPADFNPRKRKLPAEWKTPKSKFPKLMPTSILDNETSDVLFEILQVYCNVECEAEIGDIKRHEGKSNFYLIALNSRRCDNAEGGEHKSNHQYVQIFKNWIVKRCHDPDCAGYICKTKLDSYYTKKLWSENEKRFFGKTFDQIFKK